MTSKLRFLLILFVAIVVQQLMSLFWHSDRLSTSLRLFAGALFVAAGIWELVSVLLLRRGRARAGWGWGDPPEAKAWRGILMIGCGFAYFLTPLLPKYWWVVALVFAATFV